MLLLAMTELEPIVAIAFVGVVGGGLLGTISGMIFHLK
jgi:hypothetical protein